jgi:hypothetical protein
MWVWPKFAKKYHHDRITAGEKWNWKLKKEYKKLSELNFNIEEISHLPQQLSKKSSSLKNVKHKQWD